jgi:septal ring factor EnvC (AmiA/AmiB activator)
MKKFKKLQIVISSVLFLGMTIPAYGDNALQELENYVIDNAQAIVDAGEDRKALQRKLQLLQDEKQQLEKTVDQLVTRLDQLTKALEQSTASTKAYADTKASEAAKAAKDHADTKASQAEHAAKAHANTKASQAEHAAKAHANTKASQAEHAAKAHANSIKVGNCTNVTGGCGTGTTGQPVHYIDRVSFACPSERPILKNLRFVRCGSGANGLSISATCCAIVR